MSRLILASMTAGVLIVAAVGCGRGDKDKPPLPANQVAGVEQVAPAQQAPTLPEETRATRVSKQAAAPEQKGPAAPVLINGVLTNGDAALLSDFQKRVNAYLDLKKTVDKKTPDQKETRDPIQIETKQKLLAAKIIEVRTGARRGDIFTPPVEAKFRQLLTPVVKGTSGSETKQEINEEFAEADDDDANPKAALKVNVEYPEGMPLATTPPNVLLALPKLPQGLEYRFVGKNLLIRDVDANIVVDYMSRAIR